MTIIRPKLLILGDARHGKDTVGDWFIRKGYTFVSSSFFVCEKAVMPAFEAAGRSYNSVESCYADRDGRRQFWFDAIAAYNRPDRSRLGRELFALYDMYVGLRNHHELNALKLHKAYDLSVFVDASERCPPEPSSSMTIKPWMADVIIDNNGTLEDLDNTLEVLYTKWIEPLEDKLGWTRTPLDPAGLSFDGPVLEDEAILWQKGNSQLKPQDIIRFNETGECVEIVRIGAHLKSDDTTMLEVIRNQCGTKAAILPDTVVHAILIGSVPPAGY